MMAEDNRAMPSSEEIWEIYQRLEQEAGDRGYGSTLDYFARDGLQALTYADVVKACEGRRLRRDGWGRAAHHLRKLYRPGYWLNYFWGLDIRVRGVEMGRGGYCKGRVDVERNGGKISLGRRVELGKYVLLQTAPGGELVVGNDVQINRFNILSAGCKIEIGDHCVFAPGVRILDSEHSFKSRDILIKNALGTSAPVAIGKGCWLGYSVSVLKGVQIGEGAVIGAHSVVKEDVPDFAIAAGAPARVVGYRD
jgi:acetyltransferase-like isoleucine patch superfamily enzyme